MTSKFAGIYTLLPRTLYTTKFIRASLSVAKAHSQNLTRISSKPPGFLICSLYSLFFHGDPRKPTPDNQVTIGICYKPPGFLVCSSKPFFNHAGLVKASLSVAKPKEALVVAKEAAKAMPGSARAVCLPGIAYMHLDQGQRVIVQPARISLSSIGKLLWHCGVVGLKPFS